jgi:hypothetical protein
MKHPYFSSKRETQAEAEITLVVFPAGGVTGRYGSESIQAFHGSDGVQLQIGDVKAA